LVYIEKLVCKGFKSFGRDTVTVNLSSGFNCIVGPNGSGKSNVIDAILFVLGQLSAKTLRANVFSELLYSPPKPDMPPKASSALVELHFNNKDRKLEIAADKVVIERQLDESGKSVCRINGKMVARSSVIEVLGGIGVDPNGYNLVLQGEIAQMVKVNPIERRKLVEEIAGISAYDEQKEKALKKLAESETNLGKVETQLQERRRQLERLEAERKDALRYASVRDHIQQTRIESFAWTIIRGDSRIKTIDETLAERAADAERLAKELVKVEKNMTKTESEIEGIEQDIDQITGGDASRVSEQYGVISAEVDHIKGSLERARSDFDRTGQERNKLESQIESTKEQIASTEQSIKDKKTELTHLDKEIKECAADIERLEELSEKEQSSYYETTRELQDFNNQMANLDESIAEVRSTIKSDNRELGLAYEEVRDAEDTLKNTDTELSELTVNVPARRQGLQKSQEMEEERRVELDGVGQRLASAETQVAESAKLVASTREEMIKIQARHDALKEAEEAFLKRQRALARILQLRDNGDVEGVLGTVAELGTINPDYRTALEVAAGNRLSHIVVENQDVATRCVDVLKKERIGRASFIPLDRIRARKPIKAPSGKGIVGNALDLVKFDSKMRPAFEFAFSDTVVTKDFDTAKAISLNKRRAVSLEGDLVERSGLITGGYFQREVKGLSLQEQDTSPQVGTRLKGLEDILSELRQQEEQLAHESRDLERDFQELAKHNYRERIEVETLEQKLADREARAETLGEKISKAKVTIDELEKQISELRARDEELTGQRDKVKEQRDRRNEALAKSDTARLNQEIKDLKEVLEHHRRDREDIQRDIASLQVALDERFSPKLAELVVRMESLDSVLPGMEGDVQLSETELAGKETEFVNLKSEREKIDTAVKDKRVRQLRLKETVRDLRLKQEEIREAQTSNEKAVYRLQVERSRLENDLVGFKAELGAIAEVDAELKKRADQRELTAKAIEDLGEKIKELERELEAMGPVNLKSLTDYDAERQTYDEIVEKKTQLEKEHKEILSFMEEIEKEKTQKFLQVFNEIADNFSKVFAKLSPSGEANLMLENPEHPLMGGITVRSKPAGKDLVSLDAMSGGEKTLTGLALIFAIQMHSPASFYVFDEIDANLDDVNAHNVAMLISEMSKSSQFIVVSLRDTTVRRADMLIGVSNQDGISRIVAVDLQEAAETA
jgi:chromosome segregation protein